MKKFSKVVGSDGLYLLQFCILATVSDSEIDHSSNFMIMDVLNIFGVLKYQVFSPRDDRIGWGRSATILYPSYNILSESDS